MHKEGKNIISIAKPKLSNRSQAAPNITNKASIGKIIVEQVKFRMIAHQGCSIVIEIKNGGRMKITS